MDWLYLLAVQGTLKSLLQHHSSKASILQFSAFFLVQLSHPYMTTGKTIALTRRAFVGTVMSLLFNILSRLVISFLPRSNHFLNFMAAVTICSDFGTQKKFKIETIKFISIFASSFSPFVNLCEIIWFCIRILTQFRNLHYPKVLSINLIEEEAFLRIG